jgi:uncharacterized cupin superfamily protein
MERYTKPMSSSNETPTPKPEVRGPISESEIPWREWGHGRFMGRIRHFTQQYGDYRVGVVIEELQPGKVSCPAHYHLHEEEHIWVLDGVVTLRLGERKYAMKPGDYVCFPAGQRAGHCLINESDAPCRYLVIGENNPNEVAVYTDSNKIMVRGLDEIYDKSATRAYWDGEKTEDD